MVPPYSKKNLRIILHNWGMISGKSYCCWDFQMQSFGTLSTGKVPPGSIIFERRQTSLQLISMEMVRLTSIYKIKESLSAYFRDCAPNDSLYWLQVHCWWPVNVPSVHLAQFGRVRHSVSIKTLPILCYGAQSSCSALLSQNTRLRHSSFATYTVVDDEIASVMERNETCLKSVFLDVFNFFGVA